MGHLALAEGQGGQAGTHQTNHQLLTADGPVKDRWAPLAKPSRGMAVDCPDLLGRPLGRHLQAGEFLPSPLQLAQGLAAAWDPLGWDAGQVGKLRRQGGGGQGTAVPGLAAKNLLRRAQLGKDEVDREIVTMWQLLEGSC